MADFIKGELIILYLYLNATWEPIACLTSNSLSTALGVIETQTKCDPGVVITQAGSFSYTISAEGNYIDTTSVGGETTKASHDKILAEQQAKNTVQWKLDTGLVDTPAYYGSAIITDLEATFPSGDEFATFSATLNGTGAIVDTDPTT